MQSQPGTRTSATQRHVKLRGVWEKGHHVTERPFIFTIKEDGVQLNMNYICPQCGKTLKEHDVEVFLGEPPDQLSFACPEIDGETVVTPYEIK